MQVHGYWRVKIKTKNGIRYTNWQKNRFVIGLSTVIPYIIMGNTNTVYHAIGTGDANWDTNPPSAVGIFENKLVNEVYRKKPDAMFFVKAGFGKATGGDVLTIFDPRRIDNGELVGRTEPDDFFVGQTVNITAGTNFGLSRTISAYNQLTGAITVSMPFPNPVDSTTEYEIVYVSSSSPTNSMLVRTKIPFGGISDSFNFKDLREEGLFMGNATSVQDSGYMINGIRFPKIYKDNTIELEREIILTFAI